MSKRDLKKYVAQLTKEQLEEQILELYDKLSTVKVYYNFVFQPKEEELIREAKTKIAHEYFPVIKSGAKRQPKAKMRRSVAQKYIKHFVTLGVDPYRIADVMLFAIEIGQTHALENKTTSDAFLKSTFNSFAQALDFCIRHGIFVDFKSRMETITTEITLQKWKNSADFEILLEKTTNF
jgi:hypothetical protein